MGGQLQLDIGVVGGQLVADVGVMRSQLLGDGSGGFGPAESITVGSKPTEISLADIDNDGDQDIIVGAFDDNSVSILRNTGMTFDLLTLDVGNGPISVYVADTDRDGNQDLIVLNKIDSSMVIFLGNGAGAFDFSREIDVGSTPAFLRAGNLRLVE